MSFLTLWNLQERKEQASFFTSHHFRLDFSRSKLHFPTFSGEKTKPTRTPVNGTWPCELQVVSSCLTSPMAAQSSAGSMTKKPVFSDQVVREAKAAILGKFQGEKKSSQPDTLPPKKMSPGISSKKWHKWDNWYRMICIIFIYVQLYIYI